MGDAVSRSSSSAQDSIDEVALEEEKRFRDTLDRGLELLDDEFARCEDRRARRRRRGRVQALRHLRLPGRSHARSSPSERGFGVDEAGFDEEMRQQARERSEFDGLGRDGGRRRLQGSSRASVGRDRVPRLRRPRHAGEGKVTAIVVGRQARRRARGRATRSQLVVDQTPFYGESRRPGRRHRRDHAAGHGGEVAHRRHAEAGRRRASCTSARSTTGTRRGRRRRSTLAVDDERRDAIRAQPLGDAPPAPRAQAGARRARRAEGLAGRARPPALRLRALRADDRRARSAQRRGPGQRRDPRERRLARSRCCRIDEAKKRGADGDVRREVRRQACASCTIGGESIELCGGTHVRRAGDIGLFKIIARGRHRAGRAPHRGGHRRGRARLRAQARGRAGDARASGCKARAVRGRARASTSCRASSKAREREIDEAQAASSPRAAAAATCCAEARRRSRASRCSPRAVDVDDAKVLRDVGDQLRDKLGSGVVVLAAPAAPRARLVLVDGDEGPRRQGSTPASSPGPLAEVVGGKGGGRPDMAQAGGPDPSASIRQSRKSSKS